VILVFGGDGQLGQELARVAVRRQVALTALITRAQTDIGDRTAVAAALTGRKPRVTAIITAEFPTPARRPANSELDCSRFVRTFGFRARPWAEEAIKITQAVVLAQQGTAAHVA
jgi:dTDP-4-dehydrorhamnose reductase